MIVEPDGYEYPKQAIRVHQFNPDFATLFPQPAGSSDAEWPSAQMRYLGTYLRTLGCRTIVHERHYIDRHYMDDFALFYARSLRNYPNYCQRLHFFSLECDEEVWQAFMDAANRGDRAGVEEKLAEHYLGFVVVKPLPGSPVGRTVLRTVEPVAESGARRAFDSLRQYRVTVGGLSLPINGLAFQQQDQGVSACATTALWSALQRATRTESLAAPTPAAITEAASRYSLPEGRALPSEGLNYEQLCEAVRASGLAPVVLRSISEAVDRANLATYLRSGLPVLLGLRRPEDGVGHAVCAVGLRLGDVQPQTGSGVAYADGATAVDRIYVHDDRLGPYAAVELRSAADGESGTWLSIRWPDDEVAEESRLQAMLIPVPVKLRLSAGRLRELGYGMAQAMTMWMPMMGQVVVDTRFTGGGSYRQQAFDFDLSRDGLRELIGEVVLSRWVGVIEIGGTAGPIVDVVLDATETEANPAVLVLVRREGLPESWAPLLTHVAEVLGGRAVN